MPRRLWRVCPQQFLAAPPDSKSALLWAGKSCQRHTLECQSHWLRAWARVSPVFCQPNCLIRTTIASSAARPNRPLSQLVMTGPVRLSGSKREYDTQTLLSFFSRQGCSITCSPPSRGCDLSVRDISGVCEQICNRRVDLLTPWLCLWTLANSRLQTFLPSPPRVKMMALQNSGQNLS